MLDNNQVKLDSYVPDPSKKRKMEGEYAAEYSLEVSSKKIMIIHISVYHVRRRCIRSWIH